MDESKTLYRVVLIGDPAVEKLLLLAKQKMEALIQMNQVQ